MSSKQAQSKMAVMKQSKAVIESINLFVSLKTIKKV